MGHGLKGTLKDGTVVVVRNLCSKTYTPTLEFQLKHPGGRGFIYNKVRF